MSRLGPAPLGSCGGRVEAKTRLLIEIMFLFSLFWFVLTVVESGFSVVVFPFRQDNKSRAR